MLALAADASVSDAELDEFVARLATAETRSPRPGGCRAGRSGTGRR
ncbi:hypothetical protein LNP24_20290 [Klebsiella pneumoniae subsp. pneumoniae]|nr:hypothetical protein [Klebsiella pneumoniae subsp. pneumoniae]